MPIVVMLVLAVPAIAIVVLLYRYKKMRSAQHDQMVGEIGTAHDKLNPEGVVTVNGELWRARSSSPDPIYVGERVRVVGMDGHLLLVEKIH